MCLMTGRKGLWGYVTVEELIEFLQTLHYQDAEIRVDVYGLEHSFVHAYTYTKDGYVLRSSL